MSLNKTKIEWCDFTWNPVVGCEHGCSYCYAKRVHERFNLDLHPFDEPCFYGYRLDEPAKRKKPTKIFVCSMADLFGKWVPKKWIKEVLKACETAPQHTYYFLTKNPKRYEQFEEWFYLGDDPRHRVWTGASVTGPTDMEKIFKEFALSANNFLSLEPLQEAINWKMIGWVDWIIVGAQTNPLKLPKKEWIITIRKQCAELEIPLFEKNSLGKLDLPGGLIQQWPEGMNNEQ